MPICVSRKRMSRLIEILEEEYPLSVKDREELIAIIAELRRARGILSDWLVII